MFFSEDDVHCYYWLTVNSADDLKSTYSDTVNWGYLGHFFIILHIAYILIRDIPLGYKNMRV